MPDDLKRKLLQAIIDGSSTTPEEREQALKALALLTGEGRDDPQKPVQKVNSDSSTDQLESALLAATDTTSLQHVTYGDIVKFCWMHKWSNEAYSLYWKWLDIYLHTNEWGKQQFAKVVTYLGMHDVDTFNHIGREWERNNRSEDYLFPVQLQAAYIKKNPFAVHGDKTIQIVTDFLSAYPVDFLKRLQKIAVDVVKK